MQRERERGGERERERESSDIYKCWLGRDTPKIKANRWPRPTPFRRALRTTRLDRNMASATPLTRSVSMFGGGGGGDRQTAGYLGPKSLDQVVSAATDPDEDDDEEVDHRAVLSASKREGGSALFGGGAWENPEGVARIEGAFSALTPSMWPEEDVDSKGRFLTGNDKP